MKYHIWTEGCQMNVAQIQNLRVLKELGDFIYGQANPRKCGWARSAGVFAWVLAHRKC
jgi:hypothetical protein